MAARSLGIPTAIMEPNAECGMANRLLRPFVDLVFLGWEECDDGVDPRRRRVHGVPVRMGIEALRERYHAPPGSERASRILLMAGWEDSTRFNEITMSLVRTIRDAGVSLEVRHQTGPTDVASIRDQWREVGIAATAESWFDSITDALDWADFIIARPGASTVAETALTGRPALFVPLPTASEDHQSRNAELIARHGGALWSRETSWCTRELAASIASTLSSPDEWRRCAERARGALSPGASERIARDLLSAAL